MAACLATHQNTLEEQKCRLLKQLEDVNLQISKCYLSGAIASADEAQANEDEASGPFEGPEKLLEIWFQDSAESVPFGKGLRLVKRNDWEVMLDLVHCKVLSVIQGNGVDAYMLSESSMFVWPHKLILKTCGTTTLLHGLETIMELALSVGFVKGAWRAFYSRKSFMFPELQKGPHRDWRDEMAVLNSHFSGSGYHVGPMNGDHWLLYISNPNDDVLGHHAGKDHKGPPTHAVVHPAVMPRISSPDQSMELLMSDLHPESCAKFYFESTMICEDGTTLPPRLEGHVAGKILSDKLGITSLFSTSDPKAMFDAYLFQPCGYSANVITQGDRYATIHVTPEAGWSYASFETNISFGTGTPGDHRPTFKEVVDKILGIFRPGRWSLTLFSSTDEEEARESAGEHGLQMLHRSKFPLGYRCTDKITYDFEDYDLLFSTYHKTSPR